MGLTDLTTAALPTLAERGVPVPSYDRTGLVARVAHIGVGGFHRAHLAVYLHRLAERGADWGICGIGLLPGDAAMAEALQAQAHLYTLTIKDSTDRSSEIIGSIVDFVHAPDDAEPAVERLAHPDTAIISLTVTEAGYDANPRNDRTFDVIAEALERRCDAGLGGVTILSCDNLPGNGEAARRCLTAACERRGGELVEWVLESCSFPNSMVDRITPVTADADRDHLADEYELHDRWPVVAEPFCQWVVEDDFVAGRPDLGDVGVLFSDDVHAWELYKLRLLNATHSALAYLAALVPYTYVDEVLADPTFADFLERLLLDEAVPTLDAIDGHPREEYARTVLGRFANTGVRDQIARLCIDGTSKMPTFLFPTIVTQVDRGGPIEHCALALAGWARYLGIVPVDEQAFDALGDQSRPLALTALTDPSSFVDERAGFPVELRRSDRFVVAFVDAYRRLAASGVAEAIAATHS